MRMKLIGMSGSTDDVMLRDRHLARAIMGITVALAATVAPVGAQTLSGKMPGPSQIDETAAAATPSGAAELGRERFRRKAAEAAQKQLEVLADQLRQQLAKEIAARRAAQVVAAELLSRATLEEQIDDERQRLKDAARAVPPLRAGASGDASQLVTLVKGLERKLKAAEWARKLAEAQLKILSGNRGR
jgi:hypothetical protein